MFDLKMKQFKSEAEMMAYMNSPEAMAPIRKYMDHVHEVCTEGLSEQNQKLYHAWHQGTYRPTSEEQLQTARENPELYGSIMQSISMGLG